MAPVAAVRQPARLLRGGLSHPVPPRAPLVRRADVALLPDARREKQGLYAGVRSPSSELVAWHTELRPGYGSSIDAGAGGLQRLRQGRRTRFAAVHVPYIQPGETRALTPIALEPLPGRLAAGRGHLQKLARHLDETGRRRPAWAREPHAWQQIHINSPEDELRVRFTRPARRSARSAPGMGSRPSSWWAGTTAGRTRATPRTTPTRAWAPGTS